VLLLMGRRAESRGGSGAERRMGLRSEEPLAIRHIGPAFRNNGSLHTIIPGEFAQLYP
jgi:hypothetical protein